MFKKVKGKIVCSLLIGVLFSSSIANAANINYTRSYDNYKRVHRTNYDYVNYIYNNNYKNTEKQENTSTNKYPVFVWNVVTSKPNYNTNNNVILPQPKPVNPDTPNIEEKPVEDSKPIEPTEPIKPTTPSYSGLSQVESEVLRLVNIERQKGGLLPFVADSLLSNLARKKSEDMARNNYFSHTSPTYGSPFDMMKSFGVSYNTAGENIAQGQLTAQSVMNAWMNSSGHRANIMNPSFNKIGIGMYESNNGTKTWTQMFTN